MANGIIELQEEDTLLRLLFSSQDYDGEKLQNQAITKRDLKDSGLSLDLSRIVDLKIIEDRALTQANNKIAKGDFDSRKVPYISKLVNGEVLRLVDKDGQILFETEHSPVENNNAHVSLYCTLKDKSDGYYVYARNKLGELILKDICFLNELAR